MKKRIACFLLLFMIVAGTGVYAQKAKQLPKPQKRGGGPLMELLDERHSSREFSNQSMSRQMLSNLLWAAFGINRPESGKRTAPSSQNVQDIQIYAATQEGTFLYLPEKHALRKVTGQDVRPAMGEQSFVRDAAVNLVYVSDFSRYSGGNEQQKMVTAGTHCGFIGQNVYLFCTSEGLNTVFRGWIDKEKIADALNLEEDQQVMYSQSVGFPK
jgi:SagB-type dehydrogenase family enzyme